MEIARLTDPALPIAVAFVAGREAFRALPYQDTGAVWTQGYGCTYHPGGTPVKPTDPAVTEPQGMAWMEALIAPVMVRVRAMVHVPISNNAAAALVSFGFNCGTGALSGSTLMRLLNGGETIEASRQFGAWIHDSQGHVDRGLMTRRADERTLFLLPDEAPYPRIQISDTHEVYHFQSNPVSSVLSSLPAPIVQSVPDETTTDLDNQYNPEVPA